MMRPTFKWQDRGAPVETPSHLLPIPRPLADLEPYDGPVELCPTCGRVSVATTRVCLCQECRSAEYFDKSPVCDKRKGESTHD